MGGPAGYQCPSTTAKSVCALKDTFCPEGSLRPTTLADGYYAVTDGELRVAQAECDAWMQHSVPTEQRTGCECPKAFFRYRDACIECPLGFVCDTHGLHFEYAVKK